MTVHAPWFYVGEKVSQGERRGKIIASVSEYPEYTVRWDDDESESYAHGSALVHAASDES